MNFRSLSQFFTLCGIGEILTGVFLSITYPPVSRITSGGTFRRPASVPTVLEGINWDNGSIMLWDDGTPILWDT